VSDSTSTEELPPLEPTPAPVKKPRWRKPLIWVVAILVVLTGLYFTADAILRNYAEGRISSEIQQQLPKGVAAKNLDVTISGFSVIAQYLTGSFQKVHLDTPKLEVNGVPAQAEVTATDIPVDFSKPVGHISGELTVSQDSVNKFLTIPGATSSSVTLGNNTVGYTGNASVLGIPITYKAVVAPSLQSGNTVLLTPLSAKVNAAGADLDLSQFVGQALGNKPFPLCFANYLPQALTVTDLSVRKGSAEASVDANNIVLDEKTFKTEGKCPAS
jgi:hypothetical protein